MGLVGSGHDYQPTFPIIIIIIANITLAHKHARNQGTGFRCNPGGWCYLAKRLGAGEQWEEY